MELPKFTYHPNPITTESIVPSEETCPCCGQARGYAYVLTPYCYEEVENLCPWCIADGSAAQKFEAEFADAEPMVRAGLDEAVIDEVIHRTPGYVCWQQDEWLCCCGDACEFHGDLPQEELEALEMNTIAEFMKKYGVKEQGFEDLIKHYEPQGSPALYKFVCRHCGAVHLGMDFD